MRATCLGALVAVLIGAAGLSAEADPTHAEGKPQTDSDASAAQGVPSAQQLPSAAQQRSEQVEAMRTEWWAHAREVLFAGVELSAEQSREVDAVIEEQVWQRTREREIASELRASGMSGDMERVAALREMQQEIKAERRSRSDVFEELRMPLTDAQRPRFDMNRARLVAERQVLENEPPAGAVSVPRSPSS